MAMAESIYSRLKTTETRLMCPVRCSRAWSCKENLGRGKKMHTEPWSRVDRCCGGGAETIINSNKDLCELERRSVFFSFSFVRSGNPVIGGDGREWRKYT